MELTKQQSNELDSLVRTRASKKQYLANLESNNGAPKVIKGEKTALRQIEARIKELAPETDFASLDAPAPEVEQA